MSDVAARIDAVKAPKPRPATIGSLVALVAFVGLGIWSLRGLDASPGRIIESFDNVPPFLDRVFPLAWPGWEWVRETNSVHFVGWDPIWSFLHLIVVTLGIVFCGTFLASLISVPVAYGAARNTSPNPVVMLLCRGIQVVARATPSVAIASFLVYLFSFGALPGVIAIMLHSVGMISKMMADSIEQIDEGPRLAVRSTGGTKAQEFWSAIVPQAFPAWVAASLHRTDINLRDTAILGYVGVAGLGLKLSNSIHALNYHNAMPVAMTIIVLCIAFEIVSSMIRARMLGVSTARPRNAQPVMARATPPAPTGSAAVEAAMSRPWTRERIRSRIGLWLAAVVIAGSFWASTAAWGKLITFWGHLPALFRKPHVFPPSFGEFTQAEVIDAVKVTLQVAFAATLLSVVLTMLIAPFAARNVAPNSRVRTAFRGLLLLIRGVPDLILAILFVIVTGMGAVAGTLALAIGGVGLLGKLVADSLEEVPEGPQHAVRAVGSTRTQGFVSSTLPMGLPSFVSHVLYLLEQNVRSATVLGIVGGGGIGALLFKALRVTRYDEVSAVILLIIVLVLVIEGLSMLIRRGLK